MRRWACAVVLIGMAASRAAALSPGDIAIIAYGSDDPDAVAFVALAPIPNGTTIRFTDDGWLNSNAFRANEGGIQYIAPSDLPAGTVVVKPGTLPNGGWSTNSTGLGSSGFNLSTSGDQVFAFEGAPATPTLIFGLNFNSTGWVATATTSNDTALPPTLTDGDTAINLGTANKDNGYYNGTTTGSAAQLRAAIANPANWVFSDDPQTLPIWSFNVNNTFPLITSVTVAGGPFTVGDSTTVTVQLSSAPAAGSPATVAVSSAAFSVSPVNVVISDPNSSGTANVTMGFAGTHTASANPVDHASGSATSTSFVVSSPPVAPTVDAGPDRTLALNGGPLAIVMTDATANDANGLSGLNYSWTPASGSGIVSWTSRTGSVSDPTVPSDAVVTVNATGVYTFTLTATDPTALTANDSVTITVNTAPPIGAYDPPPNYYNPARPGGVWLTDGALKTALNGIIGSRTTRSYDAAKQALQLLDLDPNNSSNVILAYTGASVAKVWDAGNTWNREHLWPQSLFPGTSNLVNDLFNLRTCDPVINSTRGNNPYGLGAGYWDPDHGAPDRGDCARSIFYDAVCYMSQVTLVNGQPGANEMGDLAKLLDFHYSDPVNETERRRNHLIYSSVDNPAYFQANRNPFIDYPELVWTIFGGSNNNSRLYVSPAPPPDGASTATVNLPTIIKNAPVPPSQNITLSKTGSNPTTYSITAAGSAVTLTAGPRLTFAGGTQSRQIDAGISTSTSTPGLKTGTITVDNTDVSSAAAGQGSADGNDVITVNLPVLEHANGSFATPADQNSLTIDFGSVPVGAGVVSQNFNIYDLNTAPGFTAGLDLDSINGAGNTATLTTTATPTLNIPAGSSTAFSASMNIAAPGSFSATYTIVNSDQDYPGATGGVNLVLMLMGTVTAPTCAAADVDCNATVSSADVGPFIDMLINGTAPCSACAGDTNGDSLRDGRDISAFVQAILGP